MDRLIELRQALGRAVDELGTEVILADKAKYDLKEAEIADLEGQIDRLSRQQSRAASLARPVGAKEADGGGPIILPESLSLDEVAPHAVRRKWDENGYLRAVRKVAGFTPDPQHHFRSLGEQLLAVARYSMGGKDPNALDGRLVRAPTGAGEVDPSAGGFLVQTDFATAIFARAYDMGQLLSRVRKLAISTNANSIKIPGVDESSRATGSRWGGVQSYWVGEGGTATGTKPKFRLINLDLKKLMANWYVSDEMMADASVVNSIANQAFSEEITFMVEDGIVRGAGGGQLQGVLNSPAKIAVAKESGQTARTILKENVDKMWARLWARSQQDAVWFVNQDRWPTLNGMSQVVGTGGVPVFLPPGGLSESPYGKLMGRPVIPVEYADTVGTEGDIMLLDLSQYVLADKGGVQAASSMHVAFLADEMVFRVTYRVDGQGIWNSALTPYKGTNTQSPFITLAAR